MWNRSVSGFIHVSTNSLISAASKSQNSAGKVQIGFCTVAGLNAVKLVTLYLVQQAEYLQSFRAPQE
jgi:outer membrane protein assembly factor BamB